MVTGKTLQELKTGIKKLILFSRTGESIRLSMSFDIY